jgi:hypothetical protein
VSIVTLAGETIITLIYNKSYTFGVWKNYKRENQRDCVCEIEVYQATLAPLKYQIRALME